MIHKCRLLELLRSDSHVRSHSESLRSHSKVWLFTESLCDYLRSHSKVSGVTPMSGVTQESLRIYYFHVRSHFESLRSYSVTTTEFETIIFEFFVPKNLCIPNFKVIGFSILAVCLSAWVKGFIFSFREVEFWISLPWNMSHTTFGLKWTSFRFFLCSHRLSLSTFVYIIIYICVYHYPHLCIIIHICVSLSTFVYIIIYICIYHYLHLCIIIYICVYHYLHLCIIIYICVYLHLCISLSTFVYIIVYICILESLRSHSGSHFGVTLYLLRSHSHFWSHSGATLNSALLGYHFISEFWEYD